ncbi:serine/arginine repetitive matrix protein 2 [Rhodotorula toruloides]|uniref:Serine/arginine repetitive matrix protein 2 n=1 Tax=Rhodotorula toruloides TaxID=5286 RepID=A0A511KMQ9_RHOTO|nr:serine/arginine repetitive matrix protein 2 [Rhodotorula toruloides]
MQAASDASDHAFSVTASTDRVVIFRCSSRRRGSKRACTAHFTARRADAMALWAVMDLSIKHSCKLPPDPVPQPVVESKKRPSPASTSKKVDISPAFAESDQKPVLRSSTPFKPGSDLPAPHVRTHRPSLALGAAKKSAQKPPSAGRSPISPPLPILDLRTPSAPAPTPTPVPSAPPLVATATPFSLLLTEVGFSDPSLIASVLYLSPGVIEDFLVQVGVEHGDDARKRMKEFVQSWREMGRREGFG